MSTRTPGRTPEPAAPAEPPSADLVPSETYARIDAGPDFQHLRSTFRRFAFPMTLLFLAWYLLYVLVSAWGRGFMGTKLLGNINVGYVFGLLQFLSTFVITAIYWRHANSKLDPVAGRIRTELEQEALAVARHEGSAPASGPESGTPAGGTGAAGTPGAAAPATEPAAGDDAGAPGAVRTTGTDRTDGTA